MRVCAALVCAALVCFALFSHSQEGKREPPPANTKRIDPPTMHNLRTAHTSYWIICAWTDAKAYRPGEPIGLALKFFTETSDTFQSPEVTLIVSDSKGKAVEKRPLKINPRLRPDSVLTIYEWKTSNLIPDPNDGDLSALRGKDEYTLRVELKYKNDHVVTIDKMVISVGSLQR